MAINTMKSKTVVFTGKQRSQIIEDEISAPAPDEMLVRTTVSLISTGTECFCFRGEFDEDTVWSKWVKYPFYPGYSGVGEVMEVGGDISQFKKGDSVYTGGVHAEYQLVRPEGVIRLPEGITDEVASWSTLAFITQTAVRRAEHTMGDAAVVIGLGPLGQLVTQYLRIIGLRAILAVDTVPQRLAIAAQCGATGTFNGTAADARDFVSEHTEGNLADVVYDVTGNWKVFPTALPLARDFGRTVVLGDSPEPSKQHLSQDILTRQVTVIGTHNARLQPQYAHWTRDRQIALFYEYIKRGSFHLDDLITHRYQPDEAAQVYRQLLHNRSGTLGALFDWRLS